MKKAIILLSFTSLFFVSTYTASHGNVVVIPLRSHTPQALAQLTLSETC